MVNHSKAQPRVTYCFRKYLRTPTRSHNKEMTNIDDVKISQPHPKPNFPIVVRWLPGTQRGLVAKSKCQTDTGHFLRQMGNSGVTSEFRCTEEDGSSKQEHGVGWG